MCQSSLRWIFRLNKLLSDVCVGCIVAREGRGKDDMDDVRSDLKGPWVGPLVPLRRR